MTGGAFRNNSNLLGRRREIEELQACVERLKEEMKDLQKTMEGSRERRNQLRDELERYYKDVPRERLPLSQQKEFKAIKNMVIQEAERLRLSTFTFEDARVKEEVDEDQDAVYFAWNSNWRMAEIYQRAKEVLEEYEIQRRKKRSRCRCWNSSGREVSPWPPISWASAGGTGGAFSLTTSGRNGGFGGRRTRDMTSPSTRSGSFCKVRREQTKRYPGMKKRRRRGTPTPPTAWESCIWRGKMSRKTCQKRWLPHRVRPAGQPVCPVRSWKTVPHWAGCQTGSGAGLDVFL